jgi:hypothetical protein
MARWRLTEPHYLNVEGTKWEYSEIDRITGRPKRQQFDVPLYVDPNNEADVLQFGSREEGLVVSDGQGAKAKDLVFKGSPTPGMVPLDDDARAKSAKFKKIWEPAVEDEQGNAISFSSKLEGKFMSQMAELQAGMQQASQVKGLEEFMSSMTQMLAQQTAILAKLSEGRRV